MGNDRSSIITKRWVKLYKAWILSTLGFLCNILVRTANLKHNVTHPLSLYVVPVNNQPFCKKVLDHDSIELLRYAVHSQYWYTMFVGKRTTPF
jgi:hypothetical protein